MWAQPRDHLIHGIANLLSIGGVPETGVWDIIEVAAEATDPGLLSLFMAKKGCC